MDKFPPSAQRPALLAFVEAIGCRDRALRRDDCGDWRVNGRTGHVYAVPEGFQVFIISGSARLWGAAKKALDGVKLCNDGDEEGGFLFTELPTRSQVAALRRYAGIAKKRTLSDEELVRLRRLAADHGFRKNQNAH